jgi:zona occludens toxin
VGDLEVITLKTGIIGSGKSLSAVADLAALSDRWQTSAGEAERRPVYVHGVRGLSLPHKPLPIYPAGGRPGQDVELDDKGRPAGTIAIDWSAVPEGSLVIIDECQDAFPPRATSSKVPEHVAWCQRSRHHAVDIVLITQHPRLIDSTLRTFIGRHEHYRRMFGGARAVVYEWDSCSDGLQYKSATKRLWNYPKKAFSWYTSADQHTKQTFRIPAWVAVPVLALVGGLYAIPNAFITLTGAASGKGLGNTSATAASAPAPAIPGALPGLPAPTQPGAEVITTDLEPARPKFAGCLTMRARCLCLDTDGYEVPTTPAECRHAAREYGAAMPYPVKAPDQPPARPAPAAAASAPA